MYVAVARIGLGIGLSGGSHTGYEYNGRVGSAGSIYIYANVNVWLMSFAPLRPHDQAITQPSLHCIVMGRCPNQAGAPFSFFSAATAAADAATEKLY